MAFAMVITIIGFLLLLDKLGIVGSEVWSFFWPLLIIFIGLSMMYSKTGRRHYFCDCLPEAHTATQKKSLPRRRG